MTTVTTTLVSGQNAYVGAVSSRGEYSVSVNSGVQGPAGNAGVGITSANVVSGNLVLTYSNSTVVDVGTIVGANGEAGPAGANGAAANTGNLSFTDTTISTASVNNNIILQVFNVDPSASPAINSTSNWTFSYDGTLTLPGNNALVVSSGGIDLTAANGGWAELQSNNLNNYVWVDNDGTYVGTNWSNGSHLWTFGLDGTLNLPASTTGDGLIQATANVNLNANGSVFKFGTDGTITFPDTSTQTTAYTGTSNNTLYLGGIAANQYAYANATVSFNSITTGIPRLPANSATNVINILAGNTRTGSIYLDNSIDRVRVWPLANTGWLTLVTTDDLVTYQTTAGLSANIATLSSNNASYLGGIAAAQYAYANQIVTYTLPTANTTTLGGVKVDGTTITIAANGVISSSGGGFTNGQSISVSSLTITGSFTANGGTGTAGQVLTSNGTATYWSTVSSGATVNVNATYAWTNTHTFSNTITSSGGGVSPSSNTLGTTLGTSTQRWILNANTINLSGAATLTSATYTGAVSGITTLAAGNTTITGFANVSTTLAVTGAATFSNTVTVAANISGTAANVTITAGTFTTTFANNGVVTFPANVALGTTTITANGGVGTAGQFLTSGATGNVYWSSVDLSSYVTSSNLTANLANYATTSSLSSYQTTAGLSANVATLTANNSTNLNGQPASYYLYTLPQANSSVLGGVKVDGNTISINASSGVISTTQNLSNTGAVTFANAVITNTLTVSNTVVAAAINESFVSYSTAISGSPTITFDCTTGNMWNVTSTISSNWTANFTNLALANNYATGITMIINQGATAYLPTALQVESNVVTINWQGGSAPTGSANKKDVLGFSIFQTAANTYLVFGQLVTFG